MTVPKPAWPWPSCKLKPGTTSRGMLCTDGHATPWFCGQCPCQGFIKLALLFTAQGLCSEKFSDLLICLRPRRDPRPTTQDLACTFVASVAALLCSCLQGCITQLSGHGCFMSVGSWHRRIEGGLDVCKAFCNQSQPVTGHSFPQAVSYRSCSFILFHIENSFGT